MDPKSDSQDFETNPDFGIENKNLSKAEIEKVDEVGRIDIPDNKSF